MRIEYKLVTGKDPCTITFTPNCSKDPTLAEIFPLIKEALGHLADKFQMLCEDSTRKPISLTCLLANNPHPLSKMSIYETAVRTIKNLARNHKL